MVKLVRINCRTVPLNNTKEERAVLAKEFFRQKLVLKVIEDYGK
jgi:hypothetical protein